MTWFMWLFSWDALLATVTATGVAFGFLSALAWWHQEPPPPIVPLMPLFIVGYVAYAAGLDRGKNLGRRAR